MRTSTLLLGALLGVSLTASAQITITQSDMPAVGDTLRVSRGVADSLLNFQQTGANQTWNFANLVPLNQQVYSFGDVASAGALFGFFFGPLGGANQANLTSPVQLPIDSLPAGGGLNLGQITGFFRKTAQNYRQVGYGATVNGLPAPVTYNTNQQDIIYRFPLTFGAIDSSLSAFQVNVPNTAYLAQNQKRHNVCDGWGTLTTPFGTFQTIRVNTTLDTYDSLAVTGQMPFALQIPPRHEYKWLANGQHIPLLTISTAVVAGTEFVTGVEWRDRYRRIVLPTARPTDRALAAVTLSPNPLPAGQPLVLRHLPTDEAAVVEVYDALGRRLLHCPVNGPEAVLPLAGNQGAAAGLRVVRITTARGTVTRRVVAE